VCPPVSMISFDFGKTTAKMTFLQSNHFYAAAYSSVILIESCFARLKAYDCTAKRSFPLIYLEML